VPPVEAGAQDRLGRPVMVLQTPDPERTNFYLDNYSPNVLVAEAAFAPAVV